MNLQEFTHETQSFELKYRNMQDHVVGVVDGILDQVYDLFAKTPYYDHYAHMVINLFAEEYCVQYDVIGLSDDKMLYEKFDEYCWTLHEILSDDLVDRLGWEKDYEFFESIVMTFSSYLGLLTGFNNDIEEYLLAYLESKMKLFNIDGYRQYIALRETQHFLDYYTQELCAISVHNSSIIQKLYDDVLIKKRQFNNTISFINN